MMGQMFSVNAHSLAFDLMASSDMSVKFFSFSKNLLTIHGQCDSQHAET